MADNISELTTPYFTDGSTSLNAQNLNPIIAKINEVIRKVNGGVTPTQTVATPTISISGTTATISCSTSGATIYYTLNGNTPTTSSTQYSSPITLSGACTIKAIAVKSGMNNSSVASAAYNPSATVQPPTIYIRSLAIIMTAESGASIYYTTDGSTPTANSTQYTNAFTLPNNATIKAIAIKNGSSSSTASASFTAPDMTTNSEPVIVVEGNKAVILSNGVGSAMTYAIGQNGSYSGSYVEYTEPITLTEPCWIGARTANYGQNTINVALMYDGEKDIVVSMIPQSSFSKSYIDKNESDATKLRIVNDEVTATFTNINARFYTIQNGRKYQFDVSGFSSSSDAGSWGYANSIPDNISGYAEVSGKYDTDTAVPASSSKHISFEVTAENYSYIVTTATKYASAQSFEEIIKE